MTLLVLPHKLQQQFIN